MKSALNAVAVGIWLLWAAWLFLEELSSGFGGGSAPMHGEVGLAVALLVLVGVVGSVVASRFTEGTRAWALAALPFVFVVAGQGFLVARREHAWRERMEEEEARARAVQARFDAIPADFTYQGALDEDHQRLGSILVIDPETRSVAQVEHQRLSISTYCVGALEGQTLRLDGEMDLHDYVDASGATVYDRFTVRPDLPGPVECDHERYDFLSTDSFESLL